MNAYATGIKLALHALTRLEKRTNLDPSLIPELQDMAKKLSPVIKPGLYYLPLKSDSIHHGYATFKTVGDNNHLVLATILAKHMHPKGRSLEGLIKLPNISLKKQEGL